MCAAFACPQAELDAAEHICTQGAKYGVDGVPLPFAVCALGILSLGRETQAKSLYAHLCTSLQARGTFVGQQLPGCNMSLLLPGPGPAPALIPALHCTCYTYTKSSDNINVFQVYVHCTSYTVPCVDCVVVLDDQCICRWTGMEMFCNHTTEYGIVVDVVQPPEKTCLKDMHCKHIAHGCCK